MAKVLGYCRTCESHQVVNTKHKPINGERHCGMCGKPSLIH